MHNFASNKLVNRLVMLSTFIVLIGGGATAFGKVENTRALISEAKLYQQKGDNQAAIIQLKNALQKNPDDAEARYLLGMIYQETGDPLSAEKELRKALALGISRDKVMPGLAKVLLIQGQFQKVLDETDQTTSKGPASPEILSLRGNAYLALKKYQDAKAAYEFIDRQVQEYHTKLAKSVDEIKQLRSANIEAGGSGGSAGGGTDVVSRLNLLRTRLDQTKEELREAEIKKVAMERQLTGEAETSLVITRTGQYRTRISELQAQLSTLRMSYQDTHPDIVRIQHQVEDLHEAIKTEEARRQAAPRNADADPTAQASDDGIVHNPVYQQLRRDLTQTKIQIETLTARHGELNRQLRQEQQYGKEVHGEEVVLTQLTRDTQVNNAIYQDLLRRRENALVSMNMNLERQGMGFSIQEDAAIPLRPSGLLAWHVFILGAVFSILLPAGLLFAIVNFDGKIRAAASVSEHFKVPVLGVIPHMWNPPEVDVVQQELRLAVILVASTMLFLALVVVLRMTVLQS